MSKSKKSGRPPAPTSAPKRLLQVEGFAAMAISIGLYAHLHFSFVWFAAAFLLPDLAMVGYLANKSVGAACYNCVHTYVAPLILTAILELRGHPEALWIPLVWICHIGVDRAVGFGLKYNSDFKLTHLQKV